MESRTRASKKLILLIMLISIIAIGTAIAAVYYSILMQPSVTITGAKIVFAQGNDWPGSSSLGANATWVSLDLSAYPNATLTYDQPLNLSNVDSVGHNFKLRHVSVTPSSGQPDVGNFTFINFVVQDASGVSQASFNYTTTGSTWNPPPETSYMTLPGNTQWIIYVETKAAAGANGVAANIVVAVDVQQ